MTAPSDLKTLLAMRNGVFGWNYHHLDPSVTDWKENRTFTHHRAIITKTEINGTWGFLHGLQYTLWQHLTKVSELALSYH